MITGLHHAALAVPDIDSALEFYCGVLGFELEMDVNLPGGFMEKPFAIEKAGCKVRMVRKGGTRIEIFEFDDAETGTTNRPVNRTGITHIALGSDDVPTDVATLTTAGIVFNTEVQGTSPDQWCYGRDPFGNVIEVIEVSEEAD